MMNTVKIYDRNRFEAISIPEILNPNIKIRKKSKNQLFAIVDDVVKSRLTGENRCPVFS